MINAFLYPLSSITWLAKRELRSSVLMPLLINMVLFIAIAWLGSHYFDVFLNQWLPVDTGSAWLRPLALAIGCDDVFSHGFFLALPLSVILLHRPSMPYWLLVLSY